MLLILSFGREEFSKRCRLLIYLIVQAELESVLMRFLELTDGSDANAIAFCAG